MAELRNEDLSCIESAMQQVLNLAGPQQHVRNKIPLFDLYSIIVDGGKLRTTRMVSLTDGGMTSCRRETSDDVAPT